MPGYHNLGIFGCLYLMLCSSLESPSGSPVQNVCPSRSPAARGTLVDVLRRQRSTHQANLACRPMAAQPGRSLSALPAWCSQASSSGVCSLGNLRSNRNMGALCMSDNSVFVSSKKWLGNVPWQPIYKVRKVAALTSAGQCCLLLILFFFVFTLWALETLFEPI